MERLMTQQNTDNRSLKPPNHKVARINELRVQVKGLGSGRAEHLIPVSGRSVWVQIQVVLIDVMVDRKLDLSKVKVLSGKYHRGKKNKGI